MTDNPATAPIGATTHGLEHVLRTATDAEVDEFLEHYKNMHVAYATVWPQDPPVKYRAFIIESTLADDIPSVGPNGLRTVRTPILLQDNFPTTRQSL